jgi:hypothetical protein
MARGKEEKRSTFAELPRGEPRAKLQDVSKGKSIFFTFQTTL